LELAGKQWCESLLLGDCAFDVGVSAVSSHWSAN
jgi:hypothetical protein